jgi:hypothetical protein
MKHNRSLWLIAIIAILGLGMSLSLTGCGSSSSRSLVGIEVTEAPGKVSYFTGENLDLSGLVVTATYSNGSTAVVTEFTTNPDTTTALTPTVTSVEISFTDGGITETASFNITVVNRAYSITLSQTEEHEFPAAVHGYEATMPNALSVTVNNTGNQPTGDLTVALSGKNGVRAVTSIFCPGTGLSGAVKTRISVCLVKYILR